MLRRRAGLEMDDSAGVIGLAGPTTQARACGSGALLLNAVRRELSPA
ncbi:Hypothetical protein PFR_JS21-2_42 [Propionibacterium freudenreichii]|uniref:Uncharacterized protein n=1 Tax=Propionibacterium freudenreichii TaxID=1744 RepID=A0A2C7YP91_9ACTN|nr:putative protein without homology [Propionibacterium freudenreichii subsp. shermanii]SBM42205.1 Hypothetical protein PFR_JS2_46 [Propionibacterium freudenreichii]SBN40012.1 Hypothetical protein PFR_JS4_40 [Propionibacterium freudenreichii]SBN42383.1 Hypothetical protein PFR_J18_45 [Propionibacterium freudenreichii]SBN49568.1 Hypothetical protein PFR_JS8_53 [Propionibacterium freudenreichii]